jgi:hypothetical protein
MKATHTIVLALVLLLAAACGDVAPTSGEQVATPPAAPAAPVEPVDLAGLLQEIRIAAGIARADDVSQCRVIALGQKPCGGPERYLVYSTLTADEARLQALVERYNAAAAQRARDQDLVSDCQVLEAPVLGLEGGFCMPVPQFEM